MATKWWTLLVVCLATFMLLLDVTVVNVALPAIQSDLGSSFSDLQWVVDAYALMLAAALLTAGSFSDLLGRRKVFVTGVIAFIVASLLCGLSTSPLMLNLARGFQGVGGALMFATSLALLAQEFHGRERGTAFGVWGATTGLSVAIGPLVGGVLTEAFGWEWIFFVNIPVGIFTSVLAVSKMREGEPDRSRRIDWGGAATFSVALFCLVFALIRGNEEGWGSPMIVSLLVTSAALLIAFVVIELTIEQPMLDLNLFRKPSFGGAQAVAFFLHASMFAMFLYIVLYMQNVLDYSPLQAGVRFLPISLLSFFSAPIAGRLSAFAPVRLLMGAGLTLVGIGLLLMSGLTVDDTWTALLAGFIVAGVGIGFTNAPLASTAVAVVEPARSGVASGANSTFRQVGTATGIAALGAIFQARVADHAAQMLSTTLPPGASHRLGDAIASGAGEHAARFAPPQARETVANVAREAFVSGMNDIFVVAAIGAFVGAALGLLLVRRRDFVVSQSPAEAAA
ncbi:MAG TPA: MFS transporter [Thermoleophilaceae bacterium]|jgi:EmrB/QacA subfamily drug resistance transporter